MNTRTYALVLLLVAAAALVLADCGGGGEGEATGGGEETTREETHTPANGEAEASGNAYVALASSPGLGLVLVSSEGFVLYAFAGDRGATSSCYGACAKAWPPLLTEGPPQPSNGASAAKLGTSERRDGSVQVTYAGHPLYTYGGDDGPGQATGNGAAAFGGLWQALKGSGTPAT